MGSIPTRVWHSNTKRVRKYHIAILDRLGQNAQRIAKELSHSVRPFTRWIIALRTIFQFLDWQFLLQLHANHRWIFWKCRDGMSYHNGLQFETYDVTHSSWYTHPNCAGYFHGGFWYRACANVRITTSPECIFLGILLSSWAITKLVCCVEPKTQRQVKNIRTYAVMWYVLYEWNVWHEMKIKIFLFIVSYYLSHAILQYLWISYTKL